ncbi:MAG: radical SAM protein [Chitinophagales bacterium]|nr:radical SAM protein [Chitinophagales bacterium]
MKNEIKKVAVVGFAGFLKDYTVTFFRMPRIGPVMMATLIRDYGCEVKMFAEGVKPIDKFAIEYICSADLVAMSVLTYGANRAYAMASLIKMKNPNAIIVMGDVHPTIMPEHSLRYSDYVIRGEGDETIVELLKFLNKNQHQSLHDIAGLSFWEDGRIIHNTKRQRPKNIEVIPDLSLVHSFYEEVGMSSYIKGRMTMAVAQASRGCPVACSFCLGSAILGKGYRTRGIEGIIDNMKDIQKKAKGVKLTLFFIDNHFFINKRWTKALLKRIIEEKFNFWLVVFGQYFIGKDEELLGLMKRANVNRVFVGFESINPQTLKEFNKRQSEKAMRQCIKRIHDYGINIHGSFMLGGETDTIETVEATINFAIETRIMTASFFGLCEYPFEALNFVPTTNCLPANRLLPKENLEYYNLNFVSIYPKKMKPSQLQQVLIDAHKRFFSLKRIFKSLVRGDLYGVGRRLIGYWAQRKMVKQMKNYIPYLVEMEKGMYDANNCLIEENLPDTTFNFVNPTPDLYNNLGGIPKGKSIPPRIAEIETLNKVTDEEVALYYSK